MQPRRHGRKSFVALAAAGLAAIGCASPGPPKAPSLKLPATAHKLSATREGDVVKLQFTVSERTTDGVTIKDKSLKAKVCREVEHGGCMALPALTSEVAPGTVAVVHDALPVTLATGPNRLLGYRVELLNGRGKGAGESDAAFVAGGIGSAQVAGFAVQGSRLGALLRWQKVAQGGAVVVERKAVGAKEPVVLKPENGGDPGVLLDTGAVEGVAYEYVAHREKEAEIGARKLAMRSMDSAAVPFTLRDVYPPLAPTDATAAGFRTDDGGWAVDLVWEPVEDNGLAGYNVYRQEPGGVSAKLNAAPVTMPAFHDATAKDGVAYVWRVTAVDKHGNESAAAVVAGR
ncbi:MAG: hypothetical protein PW792_17685 [Acidobacteriaceae bacterium]|nr:hypothetical protein [Acidobacteriaceae bacterium]